MKRNREILRNWVVAGVMCVLLCIFIPVGFNQKNNEQVAESKDWPVPFASDDLTAFISIWNTSKTSSGSTDEYHVRLPLVSSGIYDFLVDWGDEGSLIEYSKEEC